MVGKASRRGFREKVLKEVWHLGEREELHNTKLFKSRVILSVVISTGRNRSRMGYTIGLKRLSLI